MVDVVFGKVIVFEWDMANEDKNRIKHKVTVKEAESVFYDAGKLILEDIRHSEREKRFILIGKTKKRRMLFTVFSIRSAKIRVISSRDTNRKEEILYEKAIGAAKVQK